jgi:hypothetical protein
MNHKQKHPKRLVSDLQLSHYPAISLISQRLNRIQPRRAQCRLVDEQEVNQIDSSLRLLYLIESIAHDTELQASRQKYRMD